MTLDSVYRAMAQAGVPEHLRDGLALYLLHRIQPGHFLSAVLVNNLREAVGRADDESLAGLRAVVSFLYEGAPAASWGSRERVEEWIGGGK